MKERRDSGVAGASLAVILGSGLGGVSDLFSIETKIPFIDIPGLTPSEVSGHAGVIQRCSVGARECLFVGGRRHFYENRVSEIESLMEYLHGAGVTELLVTSAAGSLTRQIAPGEFVLVEDILDLQFRPPSSALGCGAAVSPSFTRSVSEAARRAGIPLVRGTLCTMPGPTYETKAEVYALQNAGATVASMSVAPEATIATHLGIHVACVTLVTNWVTGISQAPLVHEDVLSVGRSAEKALSGLVERLIGGGRL